MGLCGGGEVLLVTICYSILATVSYNLALSSLLLPPLLYRDTITDITQTGDMTANIINTKFQLEIFYIFLTNRF